VGSKEPQEEILSMFQLSMLRGLQFEVAKKVVVAVQNPLPSPWGTAHISFLSKSN